jgi:hypothetical protein
MYSFFLLALLPGGMAVLTLAQPSLFFREFGRFANSNRQSSGDENRAYMQHAGLVKSSLFSTRKADSSSPLPLQRTSR